MSVVANSLSSEMFCVTYGSLYQGYIGDSYLNRLSPSFFYALNETLANAFSLSNGALLLLQGYTLALMQSQESEKSYFLYDPHERDSTGMPSVCLKFSGGGGQGW